MVYSVDLREKAVFLVEKGKSKVEVAEVFEIETIQMAKKESYWSSLKAVKVLVLFGKQTQKYLQTMLKNTQLAEMKQNLGFGISYIQMKQELIIDYTENMHELQEEKKYMLMFQEKSGKE